MNDDALRGLVREALDGIRRPAPGLTAGMRHAIATGEARPSRLNPLLAGVAVVLLALAGAGVVVWGRAALTRVAPASAPRPFAAPGLLTDPAAQVAWVVARNQAVGTAPNGHFVGTIPGSFDLYLTYRSPDGKTIVGIDGGDVRVYDAATGALRRTIQRPVSGVDQDAFSPDSRYLALLGSGSVQLLDLESGNLSTAPAPGGGGPGLIVFHPDTVMPSLFVMTDTWNHPRITVFGWHRGTLRKDQTFVTGMPSCHDPAPLVTKFMPDGTTMAVFCHATGQLTLLPAFGGTRPVRVIDTHQPNPFWFWPVFSPDGEFLYLHDQFSETVTKVDLEQRKVAAPVNEKQPDSFLGQVAELLIPNAEAGGIGSTAPISPDGRYLYLPQPNGLLVVDTTTLKPVARLLAGHPVHEVWLSGNGRYVYALIDSNVVQLAGDSHAGIILVGAERFLASAHG